MFARTELRSAASQSLSSSLIFLQQQRAAVVE